MRIELLWLITKVDRLSHRSLCLPVMIGFLEFRVSLSRANTQTVQSVIFDRNLVTQWTFCDIVISANIDPLTHLL
jgi:hypothetical protein